MLPPYCTVPNSCSCVPPPPTSMVPRLSPAFFVMMLMTPFTALAPQIAPPRAANDFDSFDVLQRHVLCVPGNFPEKWRVDRPAIHQYQQLPGELRIEAAHRYGPGVGIDLCHVHPRRHAQQIRNIRRSPVMNVLLRYAK